MSDGWGRGLLPWMNRTPERLLHCRCGRFSSPGTAFCPTCGARLTGTCPTCGGGVVQGDQYCGACGREVGLA